MAVDWFRRTTWAAADRDEFFARLRRSRTTYHKAQYLSLQAGTLLATRTAEGVAAALELVEVLLRDYPDPFELASAHLLRAECREWQGDVAGAAEAYRAALQAQRDHPRVSTTAPVEFAWLVAVHPLPRLYREALAGLDEFCAPNVSFRPSGARALIRAALGHRAAARDAARLALDAAAADPAVLRGRTRVGSGQVSDRSVHEQLEKIAAGPPAPATRRGVKRSHQQGGRR